MDEVKHFFNQLDGLKTSFKPWTKKLKQILKLEVILFFSHFLLISAFGNKNNFLYSVLKEVEMCFNETTDVNVNNEDISDQFQFVSRDSFFD